MEKMINWISETKLFNAVVGFFGRIEWEWLRWKLTGRRFNLTEEDYARIAAILDKEECVILTRRKAHLSTYVIVLADWFLRPRFGWGYWSHTCVNETTGMGDRWFDYYILEAIGKGALRSHFLDVFNCDAVALLRMTGYSPEERRQVTAQMAENARLKKPYDNTGNMADPSAVNCVEDVYDGLDEVADFASEMPRLKAMASKHGRLTPDMFYDCGEFELLLEIRR